MKPAGNIVIPCVGENNDEHFLKIFTLLKSIKLCGGTLSYQAVPVACFIDSVDSSFKERLAALGVETHVVERFDKRCPHANKLRMLEEEKDYDILVALDIDVVVAKDFSKYLEPDCISAKVVDYNPLTSDAWQQLFAFFGLSYPTERYVTTFTCEPKPIVPYFNSGVIIIPQKYVRPLRDARGKYVIGLLNAYSRLSPDRTSSILH